MSTDTKMEDIVSLAKRRGFIFQGSDVYGGIAGFYDYGPLGVALKRNITNLWWKMFVDSRDDMYGIDAAIIMNPKVWQSSGHVDTFTDPLTTCKECGMRQRADKLVESNHYFEYIDGVLSSLYDDQWSNYKRKIEEFDTFKDSNNLLRKQVEEDYAEFEKLKNAGVKIEVYYSWLEGAKDRLDKLVANQNFIGHNYDYAFAYLELLSLIITKTEEARGYIGDFARIYLDGNINCPNCGKRSWHTPIRFNMMFKTTVGPVDDESAVAYLRPETAQGIFTNYKNVVDTIYPDLPFGLAQIGKAFRNEISPRDFIFRVRELEQMEVEYFVNPNDWEGEFEKWRQAVHAWLDALGLDKNKVHELEVGDGDRAHYSKRTIDFEYDYPIGTEELLGLAYRTDFDLTNIQNASGKSMEYVVKGSNEKFVPHVIEPSFGVERAVMAVLCEAYTEDEVNGEKRVYLKLPEHLAPVKYCVSPLLKNKPELVAKAQEVYKALQAKHGNVMWDDNGNIGKRYRRQDEIGTPYCVVIDFETLEGDGTVTVRNRDTTEQTRVNISDLV